jgi:hypothetical protein
MHATILTTFGQRDLGLAALWAAGLEKFWPGHPPVLLLSDGTTTPEQLEAVAQRCGAEWLEGARCREILDARLAPDIARMAGADFWIRNLYLPSLACPTPYLIWDDVDGLFLRRPEAWIEAMRANPHAVIGAVRPGNQVAVAAHIWELAANETLVRPDLYPTHGTHSAPKAVITDRLTELAKYHRVWWSMFRPREMEQRGGPASGFVSEMGAWQCAVARWGQVQYLPRELYQIDCLSLQCEPELFHACSEKNLPWFWESFQAGYARLVGEKYEVRSET